MAWNEALDQDFLADRRRGTIDRHEVFPRQDVDRHPFALIAVARLDHHRQTDLAGGRPACLGVGHDPPERYRHARSLQQHLGEILVLGDRLGNGAGRIRLGGLDTEWRAEAFGLKPSPFADLLGGDLATNLAIADAVLAGRGPEGLVDTIVFNAAVAMWITGKTPEVSAGLDVARELLLGGAVARKIAATREFYRS